MLIDELAEALLKESKKGGLEVENDYFIFTIEMFLLMFKR